MSIPLENAVDIPRQHEWLPRRDGHEMYTNDGTAYQHKGMIHPPLAMTGVGPLRWSWRASIRGSDRPMNTWALPGDEYFDTAEEARAWVEQQAHYLIASGYQGAM